MTVDYADRACLHCPGSQLPIGENRMSFVPLRPIPVVRPLFLLAALALLTGCQREEDVRHYTAPKPESPPIPAAADRPTQRILGAIIPREEGRLWVFKLMGPTAILKEHEAEFDSFIDSVTFKDGAKAPAFKNPESWRPSAGTKMSVAAFRVGADEDAPEITVTPSGGSVDDNINRWRGQLGLKPAEADELKQTTKEKQNGDVKIVIVDLTGPGSGKMAAGKAAGRPPFGDKAPPFAHPGGAPKPPLSYTTPEGWKEGKQTQFSLAAFRAGEGPEAVDVTVSALGGTAGGLLTNVNRWRGQVGLPDWTEEQFSKEAATMMVAGGPAAYVDSGAGPSGKRIVGAVLPRGGQTWFFKMSGPAEAVAKQKPAFEAFVKSVRFEGGANE
jgi:hypothetical protein